MSSQTYNNYFQNQSVLITGGAGFIGAHLTQQLLQLGCKVTIIDDLSTGSLERIEGLDVDFHEGSILDAPLLRSITPQGSHIFHLAAFVSVSDSMNNPDRCYMVNVEGTSAVLSVAKDAGSKRVVFASSAACYGSNPQLPSSETDQLRPVSPYAESKHIGESLMVQAAHEVDTVSLRFFNVFGEGQSVHSHYAAVVSAFAQAKVEHTPPIIYGDGLQTRDFVHVSNIVHALLLAASHAQPLQGRVFNVGTGESISILQLAMTMLSKQVKPIFKPARSGDVMHSKANIAQIKSVLGYHVIEDTIERLKQ